MATEYNMILYTALISGVLATGGFAARAIWDCLASVKETRRQRRLTHIEFLLSEFFVPITMRLHREQMIWDRIIRTRQGTEGVPLGLQPGVDQLGDLDAATLENHIAIQGIIMANIARAAPQQHLYDALTKYDEHVTIYKALRDSGRSTCYPRVVGCPYPKELYGLLMVRVRQLERERDKLLGVCPSCLSSCCDFKGCHVPEAMIAEPAELESIELASAQQDVPQIRYVSSRTESQM
mgnify:CR=1 FL=1